jgi:hypothetical protein
VAEWKRSGAFAAEKRLRLLLVSWLLWKERNNRTFNNVSAPPSQVQLRVLEELNQWIAAGFAAVANFLVFLDKVVVLCSPLSPAGQLA